MKYLNLNNINIAFENIKDTPRCAIYLYLSTEEKQKINGADVLLGNLLLQGTDEKTAEDIAAELENLGIEVSIDSRCDYLKVSIVCLNEDIETALDIVSDFMLNSNFKTFEKEVFKFKNETLSAMDSPVTKASDTFYKELFKDTKYGVTNTKILETIDKMTINDVKCHYKNLLEGRKIVSIAATIEDEEKFLNMVANKLSFMKSSEQNFDKTQIKKGNKGLIKIVKEDAKQAQIFQGWMTDGATSEDCAKLSVLNTILGASGLSSRLFTELRDKRGLAYTVRSAYKTLRNAAFFMLYIGTEPSNIKKSLLGFKSEIQRIIDEPPTETELQGAKENCVGRYKYFFTQTNSQIASANGVLKINGLGFDYNEKLMEKINNVTVNDVVQVAQKYLLSEPLTVVLAPSKYLDF